MNKRFPAPIDEKNVVSDWLYEELGDMGRSVSAAVNRCCKAAFYCDGVLWEARWLVGYHTVIIESMSANASQENALKLKARVVSLFSEVEKPLVADIKLSVNVKSSFEINMAFYYEEEN